MPTIIGTTMYDKVQVIGGVKSTPCFKKHHPIPNSSLDGD